MLIAYLCIRLITLPFAYLPYKAIHALGKHLGTIAYYLIPKFRKRALSNLANAKDLNLSNEEIKKIAKQSIQSMMITSLEYAKLAKEKNISNLVTSVNSEESDAIMEKGKGAIYFCGHQANWEVLFLEGSAKMKGVAIGRPIKNKYLYKWVMDMRQKFGGTIITPKNAVKEGLRALKNGAFLGIVGDQGLPESPFSSPFLGRNAYTSPLPALLSYKTDTPIIVATTRRKDGHYYINYSKAIYPNLDAPREEEIKRLMNETLSYFEKSVKENPGQWLWLHNRWKQQPVGRIKRAYREDSIALFLPDNLDLINELPLLRELYPTENITLFVPKALQEKITLNAEIIPYKNLSDALLDDYRFKLLYNFTKDKKIDTHYKKKSANISIHLNTIKELQTLIKNA